MKVVMILFFLALLWPDKNAQVRNKLKITILYETLCPDSYSFFYSQFAPVYDAIADYTEIEFIPFGKATIVDNGKEIFCQHGKRECFGNIIESCGLHLLTNNNQLKGKFVSCHMDTFSRSNNGEKCAELVGIQFNDIIDCINNGSGVQLQLEAERITQKFQPKFIPTIIFNDQFNQDLQNRALRNFINVVCEVLNQPTPFCERTTPWEA